MRCVLILCGHPIPWTRAVHPHFSDINRFGLDIQYWLVWYVVGFDDWWYKQSELQYQRSASVESNSRTHIKYHHRVEVGHGFYEILCNQHFQTQILRFIGAKPAVSSQLNGKIRSFTDIRSMTATTETWGRVQPNHRDPCVAWICNATSPLTCCLPFMLWPAASIWRVNVLTNTICREMCKCKHREGNYSQKSGVIIAVTRRRGHAEWKLGERKRWNVKTRCRGEVCIHARE